MAVQITGVEPGSAAEKHGIAKGDVLLEINGHPVTDALDYHFYAAEKLLTVKLRGGGKVRDILVKKREYDSLGLEFETYLMDSQKFCKNKCVFCFIDQMPGGMRESLYFKDDDSRMSFLFGNYITLTNLSDTDIDRIITMKTSPVNISIHTMNPELRIEMMKNPKAGESLRFIKKLTDAGIKVNAQLVLCPGINDGEELDRSLRELSLLAPDLQSVAVVPVGLTNFREKLTTLRLFTKDEAAAVIEQINAFQRQNLRNLGSRICFAADELYLNAGLDFPDYDSYEEFSQLENGVGLLPLLRHEFDLALDAEPPRRVNRRVTIATGVSAGPEMEKLAEKAMQRFDGLKIDIISIKNKFFGETITVAGLVTGQDLIGRLKGKNPGDEILIPAVMLRRERDLFLDDISLDDAQKALNRKVTAVENDGFELLGAMLGE